MAEKTVVAEGTEAELLRDRARTLLSDAEKTEIEMVESALCESVAILEDAANQLDAPALVDLD